MKEILEQNTTLANYEIPEGEIIKIKNKKYSWVKIREDGSNNLPKRTLEAFEINYNDLLLSGRDSGIAIGFIAKGPIFIEAKKHPTIKTFE